MVTSQNGFSANDRSVVASYTIPGTRQKIALRKGDVSVILLDILGWIHANIEPLDVGIFDDWGYAERPIRGSTTTMSNHASGTGVDANATQHPLGVNGTWTAEEKRLINQRLAYYEGCVRWGENYTGRKDGMHFEINKGAADCRRVADKIRAAAGGATPSPARPTGGFLMALTDAEQAEALALLRTLNAQITGDTDGAGPDGWGWPNWRYGPDKGKPITPVDMLRTIDATVASPLDLTNRPGGDSDNLYGHVLSMRAELRAIGVSLAERLTAVETALASAGVDPDVVRAAINAAFDGALTVTSTVTAGS